MLREIASALAASSSGSSGFHAVHCACVWNCLNHFAFSSLNADFAADRKAGAAKPSRMPYSTPLELTPTRYRFPSASIAGTLTSAPPCCSGMLPVTLVETPSGKGRELAFAIRPSSLKGSSSGSSRAVAFACAPDTGRAWIDLPVFASMNQSIARPRRPPPRTSTFHASRAFVASDPSHHTASEASSAVAEGDFAPAAFAAFMAASAAEVAVTVGFVVIDSPSRNSPLTS